jgi:glycosyl transferase family 87
MIDAPPPSMAAAPRRLSLHDRLVNTPILRVLVAPGFVPVAIGTILVAALVVRALQLIGATATPLWGTDYAAYWQAAAALLGDGSPYSAAQLAGPYVAVEPGLYLYPPLVATLVTPMTGLPVSVASGIWSLLGALAFLAVGLVVARREGVARSRRDLVLVGLAGLIFPPVYIDLVVGNVNLWLFALLGLAWLGYRSDRPIVLGFAIAAATLVKLFPVVLFVWLVATRRWRALGWAVLGAGAIVVATLPVTGIQAWLDYPRAILNAASGVVSVVPTISDLLTGFLGATAARVVVLAGGGILVYACARRWPPALSFGMAVAVSVLAVPILWNQYLVLMLLPLLLVAPRARPRWLPVVPYLLMWPTGLGLILALGSWLVPGVLAWTVRTGSPTQAAER